MTAASGGSLGVEQFLAYLFFFFNSEGKRGLEVKSFDCRNFCKYDTVDTCGLFLCTLSPIEFNGTPSLLAKRA